MGIVEMFIRAALVRHAQSNDICPRCGLAGEVIVARGHFHTCEGVQAVWMDAKMMAACSKPSVFSLDNNPANTSS